MTEMSMGAGAWERGNLPTHRPDVSRETCSPTPSPNVSRETFDHYPPEGDGGDTVVGMETTATPTALAEATLTELLTTLVASLTKTITDAVRAEMEDIATNVVESSDLTDNVISSWDFRSEVEDIAKDAARDVLGEATFSVTVD